MACPLMLENVWLQQQKFEDAHSLYLRLQSGTVNVSQNSSSLAGDIAAVREDIQKALKKQPVSAAGGDSCVYKRLEALERENKELRKITDDLRAMILTVQASVGAAGQPAKAAVTAAPAKPAVVNGHAKEEEDDDDDDMDLFGSDEEEETEEAKAERERRLADYASRKSKKAAVIAKSSIVLDVKPWDDETDMAEMEKNVRTVAQDGLLWGASKLVPLAFGIKKLQISCVIEDEKVSVDDLQEKLTTDFEDYIQSVDIAAFNKI